MTDTKTVDLTVLTKVHSRASLRMEAYRIEEKRRLGVAKTSLSDVARNALLQYQSEQLRESLGVPLSGLARGNWSATHKAFRFQMNRAEYEAAAARAQRCNYTVTDVVHDALARFARTGVVPPRPR